MRAILLFPFTIIYFIVIKIWDIYWSFKKPVRLKPKVISVGNITVGGTGKTSLVKYITQNLIASDKSAAVVAKGYKRPDSNSNIVCSDDNNDWRICGDEPAMLNRSIPGLNIYVGSDKTDSARVASLDNYDIIIIDDGFQHRKLARDLNIICIDSSNPFGNKLLLPSGILREPLSALKRADVIALFVENYSDNIDIPGYLSKPIFKFKKIVTGLKDKSGQQVSYENKKAYAFSGIGNPQSFLNSLVNENIQLQQSRQFKDHHIYDIADIDSIIAESKLSEAELIITTMKDYIKLENIWPPDIPLYYLDIDLEIENKESFLKLINNEV